MFFTQDDYKKIQAWLTKNSIKDTEFNEAIEPLNGNETIALVQNGHNVKASLKDFISQLFLLGVSDFLNVSERFNEKYISLSQAIALIPFRSRKIGQVITFLDENGEWKIYQFQGERVNQWNNTTLWIDLLQAISASVNIVPDEEDITGVVQGDRTILKFKDKDYNKDDYSGLGRVYLRKNVTIITDPSTGKTTSTNLLTQKMIGKENTIYIIQYDYNLNGQTIIVPEGCILKFEGGNISNGVIKGNGTIIKADLNRIFTNIKFEGTLAVERVIPEWFGARGDNETINTKAFQDAIDFAELTASNVEIQSGEYIVDNTLYIKKQSRIHISGKGKYKTFIYLNSTEPINSLIDINSEEITSYYQFIRINDLSLYINDNAEYGIYAPKLVMSELSNISIYGAINYCVRIEYGWSNVLYNCLFSRGNNGVFLYRSANAITMRQCAFTSLSGVGLHLEAGNAISLIDCDFENVKGVPVYIKSRVTNFTVNGCYFEGNNELGFDFSNISFNVKASIIINGAITASDSSFGNTYKNESIVITNNYFNEWNTNSIVFAISVIGLNIRDNYFLKENRNCYIFDAPIYSNSVTLEQVQIGNNPLFDGNFLMSPEIQEYLSSCDIKVENAVRKNYLPSIMSFVKSNSFLIQVGKYSDKYDRINTFEIQQTAPANVYYTIQTSELAGKWVQFRCKYKTISPNVNLHMGIGFGDSVFNIGNTTLIESPSGWLDSSMYFYIPEGINTINVSFRIYGNFLDETPVSVVITQPLLAEIGTIYEDYFGDKEFNRIETLYFDPVFGSGWENGDIIYVKNKGIIEGTPYLIFADGEWYNIDGTLYTKVTIV